MSSGLYNLNNDLSTGEGMYARAVRNTVGQYQAFAFAIIVVLVLVVLVLSYKLYTKKEHFTALMPRTADTLGIERLEGEPTTKADSAFVQLNGDSTAATIQDLNSTNYCGGVTADSAASHDDAYSWQQKEIKGKETFTDNQLSRVAQGL